MAVNERKIGIAMYTVHRSIYENPERILSDLREMGYRGLEFYGPFEQFDAERWLPLLRDLGMEIWGWHVEWREWQEDRIGQTMAVLNRWQCPVAVLPCLGGRWNVGHLESEDCLDLWNRRIDQMNALEMVCRRNGLRMAYHNHDHEFRLRYGGKCVFDRLFEGLSPSILMELDTGNCIEGGGDPKEALKRFPDRQVLLHMKPFSVKNGVNAVLAAADDANQWNEILDEDRGRMVHLLVESEAECEDEIQNARACLDGARAVLKNR